jgi:hypothetical protein
MVGNKVQRTGNLEEGGLEDSQHAPTLLHLCIKYSVFLVLYDLTLQSFSAMIGTSLFDSQPPMRGRLTQNPEE